MKHFVFERELKRKGKILAKKRKRLVRKLERALKAADLCNPEEIRRLIKEGRDLEGSLVMLNIVKAEEFLVQFEIRNLSALKVQRLYRGSVMRVLYTLLKQKCARDARRVLMKDHARAMFSQKKVAEWSRTAAQNARKRLKKPLLKCTPRA